MTAVKEKRSFSNPLQPLWQFWRSPWTVWIGLRYLKSKKSSRFLSFITVLSIAGVIIGVTALIVVMSVMDGFESELRKRLMATEMHILVTPTKEVPGFQDGVAPSETLIHSGLSKVLLDDDRVVQVWPTLMTEAIMKTGNKVTGVIFKGVTSEKIKRVQSQLTEQAEASLLMERKGGETYRLPGIYVGQELAYMIGVIPGDRVTLISPTETQGPLESVPRMKRFVIEGIYSSGYPDQELHTVFAKEKTVQSFLRKRDVISQWEIVVDEFSNAPEIAAALRKRAPEFRVRDWIQLNSNLFASLQLERIAMFVILAFIIVVASFSIVTTLCLMVLEKKKEISILKAMGARRSQIGAIFLSEGILIGTLGVSLGLVLAALICYALKNYEFIQLPDIYYDRTLPVTFKPLYYGLVAISALVIVLAGCLYPSGRAAKLHPLEGLR